MPKYVTFLNDQSSFIEYSHFLKYFSIDVPEVDYIRNIKNSKH